MTDLETSMNVLATALLAGWIPLVLLLFVLLPPRRAFLTAYVVMWLFLPIARGLKLAPGVPILDKNLATAVGCLLGVLCFDNARLFSFRPRWFDLPVLVWCLVPIASAVSAGDGAYEGACAAFNYAVFWLVPYVLARVYLTDFDSITELAVALVIGGCAYVPLCLIESRISPQLNHIVYGYYQHSFAQTRRFGGWRPVVFMQHGLACAMYMAVAALLAAWLARARTVRSILGTPMLWIVPPLLFTAVWCRSLGAIVLLVVGIAVLWGGRMFHTRALLLLLVCATPAYMLLRGTGQYAPRHLVALVKQYAGQDRADSFQTRIENEDLLIDRAMLRPAVGWGFSGKFLVRDESGNTLSVPDGFWVIALGRNGLVGLVSATLMILLPVLLFLRRFPAEAWSHPKVAPAAAMAVVLGLHMIDSLMNAMMSPLFILMAAALTSLAAATPVLAQRKRQREAALTHYRALARATTATT
jgi:hypothetical protein